MSGAAGGKELTCLIFGYGYMGRIRAAVLRQASEHKAKKLEEARKKQQAKDTQGAQKIYDNLYHSLGSGEVEPFKKDCDTILQLKRAQ